MNTIEDIKSAIGTYLKIDNTPYAVMIDGDWGVGKTYLFKNEIGPLIGEKEYIYISLFGLKTIDDIEREMLKSMSWLGDDKGGFITKIFNSNSPKFGEVKIGGLGYAVQLCLQTWKSELIKQSKNIVLCFDDIERWEGDPGIYLSYVNKLVEHENGKCIIIGS